MATLSPQAPPPADPLAEGERLLRQGERGGALAAFNVAAAACHAAGDTLGLHHALRWIAKVHMQMGDFDRALPAALASAKVALSLEPVEFRLVGQMAAGICHGMVGHWADCHRHLAAALQGARAAGLADLQWACVTNLVLQACFSADELQRAGHEGQAIALLRRAGQHVAEGDAMPVPADEYPQTLWRANRAGWLRRMGRLDEAAADYERVYPRAVTHDWVDVVRHAALGRALIALQRGQTDQAEPWLVRCIVAGDTLDCYGFVKEAHLKLAQWHKDRGNAAAAQRHLRHGTRLLDALHTECRRTHEAVAAVEFDIARALGPTVSALT